jgi:hypothetical protein
MLLLSVLSAEAVVRGYKLGLLDTADYKNLCQCETLEDIKLYLVRWLACAMPQSTQWQRGRREPWGRLCFLQAALLART